MAWRVGSLQVRAHAAHACYIRSVCILLSRTQMAWRVGLLQVRVCGLVWERGLVQSSHTDELVRILQVRVCGFVCGVV